MKEMIGEFFITHADAISAAFFFLSVIGILYVARRMSGPTGSPDGITLAQDGHTVTEWPTATQKPQENAKQDWPETGDAGPPYPGGNSKVVYNPGSSVPLQVFEDDTITRHVKRIRIIQCPDATMWYADPATYLGRSFDILDKNEEGYLVRTPDGTTNYVRYWDAIVVHSIEKVKV